jgi:hypothetical protein
MAQGFWRLTLIAPIGGKIQKWNLWVKSSFCWAIRCLSVAANSHRITCCLPLDVLQEKLHFMNQNYRYIKNIYWTFKYLLLSTVRQLAILDIDNISPDTDNISCTIYLLLWSWLVCNGWQLVVLCYSLHNKFLWGNIIYWCLWCYSECASTPAQMQAEKFAWPRWNRTRNLWDTSLSWWYIAGSIPTVVRQTFQLAQGACWYICSNSFVVLTWSTIIFEWTYSAYPKDRC